MKKADMQRLARNNIEFMFDKLQSRICSYKNGDFPIYFVMEEFSKLLSVIYAYDNIELLPKSEIAEFKARRDEVRRDFLCNNR